MQLKLTPMEQRILGALMEKETTTPEYYPLTLNALAAACNQKNNRDPVMALTAEEVEEGLSSLQYDRQLVATFAGAGARVVKYTHRLTEVLGVDSAERAILCELLLRGPQTPGELRGRASRMHPFGSPAEVKGVLDALAGRRPDPYAAELPRAAGCKENRYAHALGDESMSVARTEPAGAGEAGVGGVVGRPEPGMKERVKELEERVARLEERLAALGAAGANGN